MLRSDRLSFLPDLFGNDFLAGEMQVYALAVKHITDYCGGFWHFIRIPEGGGYMMPDGDRFHLTNPDNWFDRSVSADAAGVIITALAINRRIWLHHERGDAALTRHLMLRESQLWISLTLMTNALLFTRLWTDTTSGRPTSRLRSETARSVGAYPASQIGAAARKSWQASPAGEAVRHACGAAYWPHLNRSPVKD
jgi:hypothetical protein